MPTYSATGVTLLVHKYRGTERLAAFYTRERGKVEATVRGVGKPAGKLAAAVEPLTLSRLQFAEGRAFDRLTQGQVIESFYELRTDLQRLAFASWVAELVAQTTEPGQPDPSAFDTLVATLAAMTTSAEPDLLAWAFAIKYLHGHGVGPVLHSCASCNGALTGTSRYVPDLGGCVCAGCGNAHGAGMPVSGRARGALTALARMDADKVGRLRLDPPTRGEVREVIRRHVRFHMGVEMKSDGFLEKMARAGASRGQA